MGMTWCSHTEYSGMSLTITISSCSAEKVTAKCWSGSSWRPLKISAYILATRSGVRCSPSRSGSSPMASRISRTAFSIRPRSIGPFATLIDSRLRRRPRDAAAGGARGASTGDAGARRSLGNVLQDRHDLRRVERLLLHQGGGETVERLSVGHEDVERLGVGFVDELADLGVDLARDLVGVVRLMTQLAAEENRAVLVPELLRSGLLAHAVLGV